MEAFILAETDNYLRYAGICCTLAFTLAFFSSPVYQNELRQLF